jgi:hypothetical protein
LYIKSKEAQDLPVPAEVKADGTGGRSHRLNGHSSDYAEKGDRNYSGDALRLNAPTSIERIESE